MIKKLVGFVVLETLAVVVLCETEKRVTNILKKLDK